MKSVWLGFVAGLAGCSSLTSTDPASPYYHYASGWTARLDRPLAIPAHDATVRLQHGRIVPRNSVQEYDPYCVFEVDTVRDTAQSVGPARFEVWRVSRSVETIAAAPAVSIGVGWGMDSGGPSFLYYKTVFHLRAERHPDVRSLTCAWDQMAPGNRAFMRHLTLAEIREALGDWIVLIPPKETL